MASVVGAYARAFADVVLKRKLDPAAMLAELHAVEALLRESVPLRRVMENPSIPGDRKRAVLDAVAQRLGMTRQNYYARRKQRQRRAVEGALVAGLVQRERRLQPRLGTRKLHHMLQSELQQAGVRMGRDRMFEELRKRDLLLKALPAPYPHTTQSYHNLPVFRNVIKDRPLQAPNEVWVSDLSYLRTVEGFLYMHSSPTSFRARLLAGTWAIAWRR